MFLSSFSHFCVLDMNSSKTELTEVNVRVQVIMEPGDVVMEATFLVRNNFRNITLLEMNRLSKYFQQQTCHDHPYKPQFCVCKSWLEGAKNTDRGHVWEG